MPASRNNLICLPHFGIYSAIRADAGRCQFQNQNYKLSATRRNQNQAQSFNHLSNGQESNKHLNYKIQNTINVRKIRKTSNNAPTIGKAPKNYMSNRHITLWQQHQRKEQRRPCTSNDKNMQKITIQNKLNNLSLMKEECRKC